jgi:hypothetical protein
VQVRKKWRCFNGRTEKDEIQPDSPFRWWMQKAEAFRRNVAAVQAMPI